MTLRASILAALALALAMPSVAQTPPRWNPAAPENRQVLPTFNYATVEPVIAAIGGSFERHGTADRPALTVSFANGRRAAIIFGSCERGGTACKAISIQAVWVRPAATTPAALEARIQQFNRRYAFSRAFLTADGRPALQRYLTADYGFIRGNLAVNLIVFSTQAQRFSAEVLR